MSNFLVVTHQLSYTGAPIVLLDMVRTLQKEGNNIDMISLLDGELRSEVEKMQISLSIQDRFLCQEEDFRTKVSKYDAVIVNTLIGYEVIHILKTMKIPVLWWIHEGKHFFEYFKTVIPDIATLPSNIHVYSVSGYVQRVIKERYDVWTPILHFGVEDAKKTVELSLTERVPKHKESVITFEEWDSRHKKIRFLTVAVYAMAKGQDFAIDAIEHMPEDIRKKCLFVFCGEEEEGKADSNILDKVIKASSKYEEVIHIPRQSHETVLKLMSEMDYLLVPSRIEPMPTVACEAMMMHKTVVISNVCGVADDIIDDWNGFMFKAEDVDDLCRAINRVSLLDKKEYEIICDRARIDYENKYAMEVFTPRVEQIMSHIKRRRKLILMISGRDILDIFIYAMKPTFCEMGYEVMEFNSKEIMNSLQKLELFLDSPITAVLAFNNTGMNMELVEGKNIWEQLQTPFINFLMDHPFAHKRAMDMTPLTGIVLCPDKNHMKYVQRFYPQIAVTGFMAHAAKKINMSVPKICDRSIDVIYAGNLSRVFVEQIKPDFKEVFKNYSISMEEVANDSLSELINHPARTTEEVIEEQLLSRGLKVTDEELNWIIEKLHYIDLLAVSFYREKTVRVLAEAGISIDLYGTGWETCDFIELPNVHFYGRISADQVVEKMHNAKIVLSTMTWFKDGTHDRVFNGMISGAVALTDTSIYMKEKFNAIRFTNGKLEGVTAGKGTISDKPELVMFELEKKEDEYSYPLLEEIPNIVKYLLKRNDYMQQIADNGRNHALKTETWGARAREMDRDLLEFL